MGASTSSIYISFIIIASRGFKAASASERTVMMAALASVPLRYLAGRLLGQMEPPLAVPDHASPCATCRPFI
eukprot:6195749-Pleurochrysis_carterae.AAC.4